MHKHPRDYRYEEDHRPMTEAEYMREELLGAQWAEARWRASGCADGFCGAMDCYTCRGSDAEDAYWEEGDEEFTQRMQQVADKCERVAWRRKGMLSEGFGLDESAIVSTALRWNAFHLCPEDQKIFDMLVKKGFFVPDEEGEEG